MMKSTINTALLILTLSLLAAGCSDSPLTPGGNEKEPPGSATTFGLVEVTISGIGTEQITAKAEPAFKPVKGPEGPHVAALLTSFGTIQMEPLRSGSFTLNERSRPNGGTRYAFATFKVRNANENGQAYSTPLNNLTFLAVDTDQTYGVSAVSELRLFNDDLIPAADALPIAMETIPTGRVIVARDSYTPKTVRADVLQVFTENEADNFQATLPPATINDIFPYGFITQSPGTTPGTRTLPANPAANQFDGIVSFAFKLPLQAQANKDPFTIKMMFLPVEDSQTRVTRSIDQQTFWDGPKLFHQRVQSLTSLDGVNLLFNSYFSYPADPYRFAGSQPYRIFCDPVRVAGTPANPVGLLSERPRLEFKAFTPNPFNASVNNTINPAQFQVELNAHPFNTFRDPFSIYGAQSGKFEPAAYMKLGTGIVSAASHTFMPGETVEITAQTGMQLCKAKIVRYRIETTGGSLSGFSVTSTIAAENEPISIDSGDFDKDGDADLAVAHRASSYITILLNNGGTFTASANSPHFINGTPTAIIFSDITFDEYPDIVSANGGSEAGHLSYFRNSTSGDLFLRGNYFAGGRTFDLASGDFNGDGKPDIITANTDDDNISVLIRLTVFGDVESVKTYSAGDRPVSIVSGDFDHDYDMDVAVLNASNDNIMIFENNGLGIFSPATTGPYSVGNVTAISSQALTSGDFNEDGYIDFATANIVSGTISVLLNDGDGTFDNTAGDNTYTAGAAFAGPASIISGDFDGDGDLDLIAVRSNQDQIIFFENNGSGSFTNATIINGVSTNPVSITAGDWDGDGDLDLATANKDSDDVTILINN